MQFANASALGVAALAGLDVEAVALAVLEVGMGAPSTVTVVVLVELPAHPATMTLLANTASASVRTCAIHTGCLRWTLWHI